ncbi:MAG: membrane protein insertion efficiency factor YidD [Chloroflexi bacterium]|nr:membrane protein insertion efficiency factor YidD [Chloroflexota bacterium]
MRRTALAIIRLYQKAFSPYWPTRCRYTPSCSHYAYQAMEAFGLARGMWLALRRLARCHPWGGWGYDPVPLAKAPAPQEPRS